MKILNYDEDIKKRQESDEEINDINLLISVIVPVYNAEKYMKECLDSLIYQTYKNIEIICIDDGSSDHSLDILKLYQKKDNRVKVFTQKNSGPSVARNVALDHANGDYISFVDADDFLQLNAYQILVECAVQKQKWDLIIFGGNICGNRNEYFENKLTTSFKQYIDCKPGDVIFREKAAVPFLWLHFIKRSLLENPNRIRFDENFSLGEDQIFQFEYVPRAKNVMVIDQKLYNYRITDNASLMQFYNNRKITKTECHFKIIEKVVNDWNKNNYYELYKDDVWTWAIQLIYWTIFDLPSEYRNIYAQKMINIMEKYQVQEYWIVGYEKSHYKNFFEWKMNDITIDQQIKQMENKIEREKYEIDQTLESKAFKLGRMLTKKGERLEN